MTPAELHDLLVERAVDRYEETFKKVVKYELSGGRYPGMPELSDAEWLALFHETPAPNFAQMAVTDPVKARKVMEKYARLSGGDV